MLGIEFFNSFALPVIRVRPFNQTGPGQPPSFVCSDFARQVAAIDLGLAQPVLQVGNLSVRRDFLDVRDAVGAYELLLCKGRPGDVYNVASGIAVPLRRVVDQLVSYTTTKVRICVDRQRLRKHDPKILSVNIVRLKRATGWTPKYNLESTVRDLFLYWKRELELNPKQL
jgi:GDP-4-dehydro-6-deoxy-D-mannose reductase